MVKSGSSAKYWGTTTIRVQWWLTLVNQGMTQQKQQQALLSDTKSRGLLLKHVHLTSVLFFNDTLGAGRGIQPVCTVTHCQIDYFKFSLDGE